MKKILAIALMMLLTTAGAMAQQSLTKQFKGEKGFSCITVNKAALKMMRSNSKLGRQGFSGKLKIGNFADKIERLEIVSASTPQASYKLTAACHDWIEKDNFESVIDVNEENQQASIYVLMGNPQNIFMLLAQDEETSVIIMYGTMTLDDIQGVVGN